MNFFQIKLQNCFIPEQVIKLEYIYIYQRTIAKIDEYKLAKLPFLEMEDHWVDKSWTKVLEEGYNKKEEWFEEIIWIHDIIEIKTVDIWEKKNGEKKE